MAFQLLVRGVSALRSLLFDPVVGRSGGASSKTAPIDALIVVAAHIALFFALKAILQDYVAPLVSHAIRRLIGHQQEPAELNHQEGTTSPRPTAPISPQFIKTNAPKQSYSAPIAHLHGHQDLCGPIEACLARIQDQPVEKEDIEEDRRGVRKWFVTHAPLGQKYESRELDKAWKNADRAVRAGVTEFSKYLQGLPKENVKSAPIVAGFTDRLLSREMAFDEYCQYAIGAFGIEEKWKLIGLLMHTFASCPILLAHVQRRFEEWRQSDDGLLCETQIPVCSTPGPLLHVLACPKSTSTLRRIAVRELASLSAEDWCRFLELEGLPLLELLSLAHPTLKKPILNVLSTVTRPQVRLAGKPVPPRSYGAAVAEACE